MAWQLTTVADDEVVAYDGTTVGRWTDLEPDTEHDLDGMLVRTLRRPAGERLATIATVNDVHFGEEECGILDGWGDPILRAEPDEPPYPEMMNRAAISEIRALDPDLVVVKGDLTAHGTPEEYDAFRAFYEPAFDGRLLYIRGNHESHPGAPFAAIPFQTWTLPGAIVAVLDTSRPGREGGALSDEQLDQLDVLAAEADRPVLAFGHHHIWDPSTTRDPEYFGVNPEDSERVIQLIARRPAIVGWFAGHTHRNRVRRFPATGDVPFAEVACVKDFPGAWAEYRVYEGGALQVFRRISTPEALAWTERTKVMFGGLYESYAFGGLEDRCFVIERRVS
jgi:3',5'-cyclic-AMP phosphodiesterase